MARWLFLYISKSWANEKKDKNSSEASLFLTLFTFLAAFLERYDLSIDLIT